MDALTGRVGPHPRFLLPARLRHLADFDALIEHLHAEIKERLPIHRGVIERHRGF